jgi:chaperonin cofactor prefoldin
MGKAFIKYLLSDLFAKIQENHRFLQSHNEFSQRQHENLLCKLDNLEKKMQELLKKEKISLLNHYFG